MEFEAIKCDWREQEGECDNICTNGWSKVQGHGYLIAHSCTKESEGHVKTAHAQCKPS